MKTPQQQSAFHRKTAAAWYRAPGRHVTLLPDFLQLPSPVAPDDMQHAASLKAHGDRFIRLRQPHMTRRQRETRPASQGNISGASGESQSSTTSVSEGMDFTHQSSLYSV
jgi:hypothetical protein